jgi:hypothetical protein
MKMYSKKNKILNVSIVLVISVLIGIGLQSCSEKEFDSSAPKNIFESYHKIGVKHNEGLEYFFKDIRTFHAVKLKSGDQANLNKTDYLFMAKQSVIDFCNKNENFNTSQLCEKLLNSAWKRPFLKSNDAVSISSDIKELLEELETVIAKDGGNKNLTNFQRDLEVINQKAKNRLSETDAIAIYAATSTAFSSYQYWKKNHVKWTIALNYPESLELYSDDELNRISVKNGSLTVPNIRLKNWWDETWGSFSDSVSDWWNNGGRDVVASDAGGAAVGAIGGAIIGAGAGGVGAGPAAVAGGISTGCYSSIQETIEQWIR